MHGMMTSQMGSGVLKTITGQGDAVFDVSPGMTKGAVHIADSKSINGSLNQAYESSRQSAMHESQNYQTALSNFAHRALQLSQLQGHDMRLGDGVSSQETGQYSQALAKMNHIATDVAHRTGVSKDEAMQRLTSAGLGLHAGASSDRSILGTFAKKTVGWSAGGDIHTNASRTSTSQDRFHDGFDNNVSARESQDFNKSLNYVSHFAQTHHFDDSHSQGVSLSNQMGADLRDAQTASHNYDASLSQSERIHNAKSYVESHGAQVTTDLNQAFPAYVASRVGKSTRDELFAHPGDLASLQKLQTLGDDFVSHKRDTLIAEYGNQHQASKVDALYQHNAENIKTKEAALGSTYKNNSETLINQAHDQNLGINAQAPQQLQQSIHENIHHYKDESAADGHAIQATQQRTTELVDNKIEHGKELAKRNTLLPKKATRFYDDREN